MWPLKVTGWHSEHLSAMLEMLDPLTLRSHWPTRMSTQTQAHTTLQQVNLMCSCVFIDIWVHQDWMQSTAATVLIDVILSVDLPQVFSPLRSEESTTSASPAIMAQRDQWAWDWWRTESRWLPCTTMQPETAGRRQPMAWLCSLKWETRCTWGSG